ncbi:hypothetical protein EMIHUDRAFT_109941 [Emiliania huxleyi CCMP1516]|uniref:Glycoside hydrolase family 5 domain-containing protein n=2 Tax=Emiliania huxleyi TaxID=2903 RepID=A0A0D3KNH1_EMIH1|nr:hypothetical protein EMIHUDRAFT_109941 [Emiliania huxleyi CCMP1516]EOD37306.1 hypothetical protein EMIHUDRAFT_109941 [Emiliania huxleyi CCMP1516]|eukprot:XP_005789735.1 hypothetical protein EMIHUDRAFT_109941 [Emiliania huxleyi CCMP1516]
MLALLAQGLALHPSERELTFASAHQHDSSLLGGASDNVALPRDAAGQPAWMAPVLIDGPSQPQQPSQMLALGADGQLEMQGRPIHLNGVNSAWVTTETYGSDFNTSAATGFAANSFCEFRQQVETLRLHGGNSIRLWMFEDAGMEEWRAPFLLNASGHITGLADGVVDAFKRYLDIARNHSVLVIPVMWSAALVRTALCCSVLGDETALQAFIENALRPLVSATRSDPVIAMWEIVNEIEGVLNMSTSSPAGGGCSDLSAVARCAGPNNQPGWNLEQGGTCLFPVASLQRFINRQIAAVKLESPQHLVTSSSWSQCAMTSEFGGARVWADKCLQDAGGQQTGTIDVWQVHDYPKEDNGAAFGTGSPVTTTASQYNLGSRPILVGEISNRWTYYTPNSSATYPPVPTFNQSMSNVTKHVLNNGFAGSLSWAFTCLVGYGHDTACLGRADLSDGLSGWPRGSFAPLKLQAPTNYDLSGSVTCPAECGTEPVDLAPSPDYTCPERAAWGECTQDWMRGYCSFSCYQCDPNCGTDTPCLLT